jgi:hypothetical protein
VVNSAVLLRASAAPLPLQTFGTVTWLSPHSDLLVAASPKAPRGWLRGAGPHSVLMPLEEPFRVDSAGVIGPYVVSVLPQTYSPPVVAVWREADFPAPLWVCEGPSSVPMHLVLALLTSGLVDLATPACLDRFSWRLISRWGVGRQLVCTPHGIVSIGDQQVRRAPLVRDRAGRLAVGIATHVLPVRGVLRLHRTAHPAVLLAESGSRVFVLALVPYLRVVGSFPNSGAFFGPGRGVSC